MGEGGVCKWEDRFGKRLGRLVRRERGSLEKEEVCLQGRWRFRWRESLGFEKEDEGRKKVGAGYERKKRKRER